MMIDATTGEFFDAPKDDDDLGWNRIIAGSYRQELYRALIAKGMNRKDAAEEVLKTVVKTHEKEEERKQDEQR